MLHRNLANYAAKLIEGDPDEVIHVNFDPIPGYDNYPSMTVIREAPMMPPPMVDEPSIIMPFPMEQEKPKPPRLIGYQKIWPEGMEEGEYPTYVGAIPNSIILKGISRMLEDIRRDMKNLEGQLSVIYDD